MDNEKLIKLVAYQLKCLVESKGYREAIVVLGKWVESSPQITEEEINYLLTFVSSKTKEEMSWLKVL